VQGRGEGFNQTRLKLKRGVIQLLGEIVDAHRGTDATGKSSRETERLVGENELWG
jgi:hypothetical protein